MAKVTPNGSTGRFSVAANGDGSQATIRESASGKILALKGYGALAGQFAVREGIDLSEPIAAQSSRTKPRKKVATIHKSA